MFRYSIIVLCVMYYDLSPNLSSKFATPNRGAIISLDVEPPFLGTWRGLEGRETEGEKHL